MAIVWRIGILTGIYNEEQSMSLKLGLFMPEVHIPIVDEERLLREQPARSVAFLTLVTGKKWLMKRITPRPGSSES